MSEADVKLYGSTVVKTKTLLDFLSVQSSGRSLTELSDGTGLTKPTIRKIMDTLIYMNWVYEDQNGNFTVGIGMIKYGAAAQAQFNIVLLAEPYLRRLSERFGETINFVIPDRNRVVLMKKFEGTHSVALKSIVGGNMDMYSTSVGKSILATYSDAELQEYIAQTDLIAKTPNTISDPDELLVEIVNVRKNGFAYERNENEMDISCVGTAISRNGHVFGAFSISAPSYRVNTEREQEFATAILETKDEILAGIGSQIY
jgi:DNA-binding IclR family transcriptional regulator